MTQTATKQANHNIAEKLKVVLADSYALYLKTQNYHWNVTGPQFNSLHMMFEGQYTDLAAAIDEIAERIRALGEKAPGTWKAYEEVSSIKDGNENAEAKVMVEELANDQDVICDTLNDALKVAQDIGDEVSTDLIIGRLTVHEKNAWMLRSSI